MQVHLKMNANTMVAGALEKPSLVVRLYNALRGAWSPAEIMDTTTPTTDTPATTTTTTTTTTTADTPQTPTQRLVALRAHARDLQLAFSSANAERSLRLSVLIADAEQHNEKIDTMGAGQKGFWDTSLYLRMVAVVMNSQREVQTYQEQSIRLEEDHHRALVEMKEQERLLMMRERQAEQQREAEETGQEDGEWAGEQDGDEEEEQVVVM